MHVCLTVKYISNLAARLRALIGLMSWQMHLRHQASLVRYDRHTHYHVRIRIELLHRGVVLLLIEFNCHFLLCSIAWLHIF